MAIVLKIAEKEMTSGSDEVAEILTSSKTKELFGYHCKLQRSLLCATPLTKMSCNGSNYHCDTSCSERLQHYLKWVLEHGEKKKYHNSL